MYGCKKEREGKEAGKRRVGSERGIEVRCVRVCVCEKERREIGEMERGKKSKFKRVSKEKRDKKCD